MKKIAIKGHPTRGEDIIKILGSLGGINEVGLKGTQPIGYYYLEDHNSIRCKPYFAIIDRYTCYTLEEYEQKFSNIMEKIAIYGHSTRSKDVIKTLESLGGKNRCGHEGWNEYNGYYIDENNYICCDAPKNIHKDYKLYTLEEYEQKFNNMETKRNIQIDLTTAKEWYKQGGDLRKVALQAFSENELQELPKSWEEYCEINPYLDVDKTIFLLADGNINPISSTFYARRNFPGAVPSKERAEQFLILNKLLQIRDYYNQGWEPDWDNEMENKFVIMGERGKLVLYVFSFTMCLFAFKTKELRDEFFKNFKAELEKIKEFL